MKYNKYVLLVLLTLIIATLACGSSSGAKVNLPDDSPISSSEEELEPAQQEEPEPTATELVKKEELKPTATKAIGTARSNPAPVGSEIIADEMAFIILGAIRPADSIIKQGNLFNTEPASEEEYVLVELQATCQKSIDDKCSLSSFMNFNLIGSKGISYNPEILVAGVEGLLDSVEFFGEASVSGYLPFIIGQDETDLILVYDPFLFGDAFYLAVPEN